MAVASRRVCIAVLCIVVCVAVHAQEDRPRVAVIPFNHINTSLADAQTLTGVFETELVQTGAFDVIEQTQMNEILEAQEYAASDCTDESCAIEFGKLLSAERIVLGALSAIGSRYVLNVKMIDVATGKHVNADKITADDLGALPDDMRILAYRLAGMTVREGGQETIATSFGQLFVETDPAGADVSINGVRRGVSPDLFDGVPRGTVRIEAWKDDLYAASDVEVSGDMTRVSLKLIASTGSLFMKSSVAEVQVYVDGALLGELGSGLFEGLPVGPHLLELRGEGLYWSEEVLVVKDTTSRVQAEPQEYGEIVYALPEGATAEIVGPSYREVVRGQGTLSPVWVGEYTVTVGGGKYESVADTLEITTGAVVEVKPDLVVAEAGVAVSQLRAELDSLIARRQETRQALSAMQERSEKASASSRTFLVAGISAAAAGGASLIGSLVCVLLSNSAYEDYLGATEQSEIDSHRSRYELLDRVSLITAGAGGLAGGGGTALILLRPNPRKMQSQQEELQLELQELESRIASIEEELR